MHVNIQLPLQTLYEGSAIKLTGVATTGSFGLLPNHVDLVSDLLPSVLVIGTPDDKELFFAIDDGILVKQGNVVNVVSRMGMQGHDLDHLEAEVRERFIQVDDDERVARSALARLEADMLRRFSNLNRELNG